MTNVFPLELNITKYKKFKKIEMYKNGVFGNFGNGENCVHQIWRKI